MSYGFALNVLSFIMRMIKTKKKKKTGENEKKMLLEAFNVSVVASVDTHDVVVIDCSVLSMLFSLIHTKF